eukprot:GHVQ01011741.1.p1 GENE.GHVQ01011741.1~~GHVQ01011741.1.p1  ORF type:complete len:454 (+),score=54.38 GHVQ01011741.1:374-1735(+)
MDEEYDVVVCGTGLKECILSGLLSVHGNKVLHVDQNPYYGAESASLNLTNLYDKFKKGEPPVGWGANREWNVDLVPKFVMACGQLVKMLLHTKVTRYLEWQVIEGTYVYQFQKAGFFSGPKYVHKVPSSDKEALVSPLMGMLEKNRCKNFFQYCAHWEHSNQQTWKGLDPDKNTMEELFNHFGLHSNTVDFVGHAVALYTNDSYLKRPIAATLDKIKLYMNSISRYGKSPFIYPLYGLGGLPEGFSRLCAIHGGTYMLNKPIEGFVYGDDGKIIGVKSKDGETAKCKKVICDPTYVLGTPKIRLDGKVIRCICILNAPIPHTNESTSCQIIIPQRQLNRNHDIYVTMVSSTHGVAKAGKFIALISTTVESEDPMAELRPAIDLLGPVEETFTQISDLWIPTDDGHADNVYVSASYDATSHFESAAEDVLRIWKNMQGYDLDLTIKPDEQEEQL